MPRRYMLRLGERYEAALALQDARRRTLMIEAIRIHEDYGRFLASLLPENGAASKGI